MNVEKETARAVAEKKEEGLMLRPISNSLSSRWGDNFFDDFFDYFAEPVRSTLGYHPTSAGVMRTDIRENDNSYELDIDLPGYKKEDIKAELKDGYLTIGAEKKSENEKKDENGKFIRRERYYGTCNRSFYVGEDVTIEDIKAKFEDGILKVSVPKKEQTPAVEESKYVTIEG